MHSSADKAINFSKVVTQLPAQCAICFMKVQLISRLTSQGSVAMPSRHSVACAGRNSHDVAAAAAAAAAATSDK